MGVVRGEGGLLELLVANVLDHYGIKFGRGLDAPAGPTGQTSKVDFTVYRAIGFETGFYISCKWQASSGSAFEKLPHERDKILNFYDRPTLLVMSGTCKEFLEMREYMKAFVNHKLLDVQSIDQFITFAKHLNGGDGKSFLRKFNDPDQPRLFA